MPYVTPAQLRALPNLGDAAKFTDAELTAATTWFETKFERYTGVAWEPRTVVDERLDGTGESTLLIGHMYPISVQGVEVVSDAGGITAFTAADLADLRLARHGEIRRVSRGSFPRGDGNIIVDYIHGHPSPPADVVEAALIAIRDKVLTDNVGNRQFAVQTQEGIIRSSRPGPDRPFGIDDVDEVANARRSWNPGIG